MFKCLLSICFLFRVFLFLRKHWLQIPLLWQHFTSFFFLTVGVDSPFGSKSVSLYLLVTRAVLFSKAFSTGISEALIWYFPCLPYGASYISSMCSKPVTADVWLRAQLLFLPQTCSLCWHLRMQVALLECWLETYLLVLSYLSSVCTDGKTSLSITDSWEISKQCLTHCE